MLGALMYEHAAILVRVGEKDENGQHAELMNCQELSSSSIPLSDIEEMLGGPVVLSPVLLKDAPGGDFTLAFYSAADPVDTNNVAASLMSMAFGGKTLKGDVFICGNPVDGVPQALTGYQAAAITMATSDHIASKGVPSEHYVDGIKV